MAASNDLFQPAALGPHTLQNHIAMAPMTRNRAIGNIPNDLMAAYYGQRGSAGLIVTEGTSPSPNGVGYPRIPGIYTAKQVAAWRAVTDAAHAGGARIFVQLMHTGRIGHELNLPDGARVLAPSAVPAGEQMYTDQQGMVPLPTPVAMTTEDIAATQAEFVQAARNAVDAGFDGIELHAANGYLLEQFLRPNSNIRDDVYGGAIEGRSRMVVEIAQQAAAAIGAERVGIRLSPFGVFNDMPPYDEMEADYAYLAQRLADVGLLYVHIVDHSAMGAPPVPDSMKQTVRRHFPQGVILSGGYTRERAEVDLAAGRGDLVAVGRDFLANPDLPARWQQQAPLNPPDAETFYTPGEKGYTDYPSL